MKTIKAIIGTIIIIISTPFLILGVAGFSIGSKLIDGDDNSHGLVKRLEDQ